ncbi:MAG TPA: hypothetical protein VG275_07050 [Solirubrobacteraceae bacterium]|jgi:hypothetical protein|nr:hypothetical protein [Solirubrobacteraceae bacterium]
MSEQDDPRDRSIEQRLRQAREAGAEQERIKSEIRWLKQDSVEVRDEMRELRGEVKQMNKTLEGLVATLRRDEKNRRERGEESMTRREKLYWSFTGMVAFGSLITAVIATVLR